MLKKTMTFKDMDGNEITEDFYFNLNKAELIELELSKKDGITEHLRKLIASNDGGQIIATFKEILIMSIGRRSEDGRLFLKGPEITQEFTMSNAYSDMFMELATNADFAVDFIKGIVPKDLLETVASGQPVTDLQAADEEKPAWFIEGRIPTEAELKGASPDLLMEAFRRKNTPQ